MMESEKCEAKPIGKTSLHIACANCEIEVAKKLLNAGADVNARIREGQSEGATPLYLLAEKVMIYKTNPDFFNLIELLLKNGADVTIKCHDCTPIHLIYKLTRYDWNDGEDYAITARLVLPAVHALLKSQKSYDINPVNCHGFSHFHMACAMNDLETATKFLDYGIDINGQIDPSATYNDPGFTPLHFAMVHGSREMIYFLLERGADVNIEDADGDKPLHAAIRRQWVDLPLIKTMISYGADIHAKNLKGETILYKLLKSVNLNLDILEFFLNCGCFMNISELTVDEEYGIFGLAMSYPAPTEIQSILERLVQVDEVKNAIQSGYNIIQSIVSIDQDGEVTIDDYLNAIELMMKNGCDIDQRDAKGETALHKAVYFFNADAIHALLRLGVDINVVDNQKECSFDYETFLSVDFLGDSYMINAVKEPAYHIWKMKLLELELRESNLKYLEVAAKSLSFVKLEKACHDELIKAQETEICQCLTVKDFLSKLGAVAEYPRMHSVKRSIVDKFFQRSAELRRDFPELCGILAFQYRKALARMGLFHPGKEAMALICPDGFPDLCLEALLRYFTNNELKLLIDSVNELFKVE